mmetsp:Transcript_32438/g.70598  ORF Transcript_32438/g.70598 Transcript_32438/m.70598 type:complete len:614 (+) Transcript_32438:3-1844(+)
MLHVGTPRRSSAAPLSRLVLLLLQILPAPALGEPRQPLGCIEHLPLRVILREEPAQILHRVRSRRAVRLQHGRLAEVRAEVSQHASEDQQLLLPLRVVHMLVEDRVEEVAGGVVQQSVLLGLDDFGFANASFLEEPRSRREPRLAGLLPSHPVQRIHEVDHGQVERAPQGNQGLVKLLHDDGEHLPRPQGRVDEALELRYRSQSEVLHHGLVDVPHFVPRLHLRSSPPVRSGRPHELGGIAEARHDEGLLDQSLVRGGHLVEELTFVIGAPVLLRLVRRPARLAVHDRPRLDVEETPVPRRQHALGGAPRVPEEPPILRLVAGVLEVRAGDDLQVMPGGEGVEHADEAAGFSRLLLRPEEREVPLNRRVRTRDVAAARREHGLDRLEVLRGRAAAAAQAQLPHLRRQEGQPQPQQVLVQHHRPGPLYLRNVGEGQHERRLHLEGRMEVAGEKRTADHFGQDAGVSGGRRRVRVPGEQQDLLLARRAALAGLQGLHAHEPHRGQQDQRRQRHGDAELPAPQDPPEAARLCIGGLGGIPLHAASAREAHLLVSLGRLRLLPRRLRRPDDAASQLVELELGLGPVRGSVLARGRHGTPAGRAFRWPKYSRKWRFFS